MLRMSLFSLIGFFFQAEDGIRVYKVTGVQTCALPICFPLNGQWQINGKLVGDCEDPNDIRFAIKKNSVEKRSEERRVGKQGVGRDKEDEHENLQKHREAAIPNDQLVAGGHHGSALGEA